MPYIVIEDKNLSINGCIFEVIEETDKLFVINNGGVNVWIPKDHARLMAERYKPEAGIPEAFDADGSMYCPPGGHGKPTPSGYLEEWPNTDGPEYFGDPENKDETIHHLNVTINSLRKRSEKKGKINADLSIRVDMLEKTIRELDKDMDGVIDDNSMLKGKINQMTEEANERDEYAKRLFNQLQTAKAERDEYKKSNEFHMNEVELGNERRQKMKDTVESLHEEHEVKNKKIADQATTIREYEIELERYKRIVDALTKRSSF